MLSVAAGTEAPYRAVPSQNPSLVACHHCTTRQTICDGTNPCGACIERKRCCYSEGSPALGRQDPQILKCHECAKTRQVCDGRNPCGTCIRRIINCYPERSKKPRKQDPWIQKCYWCAQRGQVCNGKNPCGTCSRNQRRCKPHLSRQGVANGSFNTSAYTATEAPAGEGVRESYDFYDNDV